LGKTVKEVRTDKYVKLDGKGSHFDFELITETEITLNEIQVKAEDYTWEYEEEWYKYVQETNFTYIDEDGYQYDYYPYYEYIDQSVLTDIWQIYEFFQDGGHDTIKACVYEYDGTLDLKGDVDVGQFSTLDVVLEEEYVVSYGKFFGLMILPLFIMSALLVVYQFTRKKAPADALPPRAAAIPPPTQGPPPAAQPPPGPGGPPPPY
jgi:hypothetical protein